ncbi:MAG TPA: cellulase family glycosylhydrolase [Frankiaceae bacterium]|nr:cellulase family glycosylhydrolase [Frankiaceae bacterium]
MHLSALTRFGRWGALALAAGISATAFAPTGSAAAPVAAPAGQTTVSGLLSSAATAFGSAATGWSSYAGGGVIQLPTVGRLATGALAVTSRGPWTGASSGNFNVTPGVRYSASTWASALSAAHSVGLAMQFRDASGALITSYGTQMSQPVIDTTSGWTQTPPVVGIAPPGAVSGSLVFVDFDGPAGDVQRLDDVTLTGTSGVAARIVGPLTTRGTNVIDALGRVVSFHGVDIDGLQYSNRANVTTSELAVAQAWGANFVRLPLAENYLVAGDCSYDSSYLGKVDAMVNAATSNGLFIMLDLHTNALKRCAAPAQQNMPDANAVTVWNALGARYKSNPLVGFDLYNEPHDVSDAVWHSGGTVTSSGVTYQAVGMQTLYNTVRATGATNLVFASGSNWATSFPATAPLTGTSNLVYAAHAYTCPTGLPSSGASCTAGPDGTIYDPSGLLSHFAPIGQTMPVMVTEFGFPDKNDGRYVTNVQNYAAAHGWVGWDVYAFDNSTGGLFDLWKNTGSLIEPATSGMAVMTGMFGD